MLFFLTAHDDRGNIKQKRRVGFKTPHPNSHLGQNRTVQMAIDSYYDNFSMGETSNQRGRRSPHNLPYPNPRRIPNQRRPGNPTVVPPWRVNKGGNINKMITWYKAIVRIKQT